jgi:hypothetical protein
MLQPDEVVIHSSFVRQRGGDMLEDSKRRGKAQWVLEYGYRLFQKMVYTDVAKAWSKTV